MNADAEFLTTLDARWLNDKDRLVLAPLSFYSKKFKQIFTVPPGFVSDLASVPRWPLVYWLFGGSADEPAVLHDWLYATGILSRADSDEVFAEACEAKKLYAWPRWLAVRVGGGVHYEGKR